MTLVKVVTPVLDVGSVVAAGLTCCQNEDSVLTHRSGVPHPC